MGTLPEEIDMTEESIAAVFPGQGTQRRGMGKDFYDNVDISKKTYEEASDALGWDVAALCFEDDERINLTEYAQPGIVATEIAMFRGIQSLYDFQPHYFGGHSLGEYTGLVAAGAIPFSDTLKTVQMRGRLMQQATPPGAGGMAAVIGPDLDIGKIREILEDLTIDVANINSTHQVVLSGAADSIKIAETRLIEAFADAHAEETFRFVPLNVSAPFHSRFMVTIRDTFRDVLTAASAKFNAGRANRVTSNYSGAFHSGSTSNIIEALVSQVSSAVNWRDNMTALAGKAQKIYEIGPNRPLKNFFSSIHVPCKSITNFSTAKRVFATGG